LTWNQNFVAKDTDRSVHQPPELPGPAKRDQIRSVAKATPTNETGIRRQTGDEHRAQIVLLDGFIWRKGIGTFEVKADGIHLDFTDTN
jgi:hypothetical protein